MKKDLVTVVILHYKQKELIHTSIDSVLNQNYENIELLFADDCSGDLKDIDVAAYVEAHKGDNIKNLICQFNDVNLGTIKNINKAIDNANGEYILFFAADDKLYDGDVISNMVSALNTLPDETELICGQSIMMDQNLENEIDNFVPKEIVQTGNYMTADEQHTVLLFQCAYAMGATLFKKSCFDRFGKFDENYKVIEDWNFFLDYTMAGNKINYTDVKVLMHRSGGISENGKAKALSKIYSDDINKIYIEKVLPFVKKEKDIDRRRKIILHYRDVTNNKIKLLKVLLTNPAVCICQLKRMISKKKA